MRKIEVCVTDLQGAREAFEAGAQRIELCSALTIGGVTPSYGCIKTIKDHLPNLDINVLIRPRGGNFCYNSEEVDIMIQDIKMCKELGINGVAIGALTSNGDIDIATMHQLVEAAQGLSLTFHRAFDCCNDPYVALEQIIALGCDRILTSGQATCVEKGSDTLKRLVYLANNRIIIMPGCGITTSNIQQLEHETKAKEFHASAQAPIKQSILNEKSRELFGDISKQTNKEIISLLIG
ncbi:MAG: copper homeostasis protein CutC [Bacteroidales bacterium]|nr:copper homeostasis protein CutC [Bacteroidales bacterium]